MGDASKPVSAQVRIPASGYPVRVITAAAARPVTTVRAARASHGPWPPATLPANLVTTALSDWLPSQPTNPVLLPRANTPPSHQRRESAGSAKNPSPTVTANT